MKCILEVYAGDRYKFTKAAIVAAFIFADLRVNAHDSAWKQFDFSPCLKLCRIWY